MAEILIVDDEESIRLLIRAALESDGHTIQEAESTEEALNVLGSFDPDLVISDIHMEGMSGYDLLEQVREKTETAHTPFIFVTGVGGRETYRHGMELGADDFLNKPFSKDELLASVRTRLKFRQLLREESERRIEDLRQSISLALPHEFRTPLTAILAFSNILSEDEDITPEEGRKFAGMIHASAERLHHLAENYLVYAQTELAESDPEMIRQMREQATPNIHTLLRSCATDKAVEHERTTDLAVQADSAHCAISYDHIAKIVTELLDNAFKFSSPGDAVDLSGTARGDTYVVTVRDRGKGMAIDELRNVEFFRQFGRQKKEQQGVGLGLAIAKKLIELYGGSLVLESVPGAGTTVCLTIPIVSE